MSDDIVVRGARENNLRDVGLTIPVGKITVFTGVSGSGKSSLVFDTIAAESQRQLNDTFPAFVRNRLPQLGKPDVDALEHLSVAIIVDQRPSSWSSAIPHPLPGRSESRRCQVLSRCSRSGRMSV